MPSPRLKLRFLGACDIASRRGPVHLESSKTTALLAVLALSPGPQARARLMGLLWPELGEERASGNLRRAVWDLRRKLGDGGEPPLRASRLELELVHDGAIDLDVARFEWAARRLRGAARERDAELSGQELVDVEEAVELYRGDLLAGLAVPDALEFEEWLAGERERLRRAAEQALTRLVAVQRAHGDLGAAIAHARRLLALDPWREEVHRSVMELLLATGEPAAALAQFESCRRLLAEQLQAAPSAETVRLAESIRRSSPAAPAEHETGSSARPSLPPMHNLPVPSTPFVGRENELALVLAELDRSGCRLLSLVGPGGIGKTRLALRLGQAMIAVRDRPSPFPDGVLFVGPRESGGRGALAMALAEALGVAPREALEGAGDLEATLLAALRGRRVLLLLDGLEHRREEAGWLSTLLALAPEVKIVATTRERLQLPEEWVCELRGLDLPRDRRVEPAAEGAGGERDESAAVQLFVQTARRARLGWRPAAADVPLIGEICRRLEGLPLGIELAAGWVGALSVGEIASEIARDVAGLDPPLEGEGRPRRGLRSVFESSWARLSADERGALAALSCFVGGFTRSAAEKVAGARLATLRALVDRSLLRYDPAGRYGLHEVLRHFAAERLAGSPATREAVAERHAGWFAERLAEIVPRPAFGASRTVLGEIAAELENVRAAWGWGIGAGRFAIVAGGLDAVAAFASSSGWLGAGDEMLSAALDALPPRAGGPADLAHQLLAGRLRAARGALRNRAGDTRHARADLVVGRRALRRAGARPAAAAALFHLGECDYLEGRYRQSFRRLSAALAEIRDGGSLELEADVLGRIGRVALELGRHGEAEAAFGESLVSARRAGVENAELFALNQLGYVAYFERRPADAETRFVEALAQAREIGDRAAAGSASTGLAYVAEDAGEFARARQAYETSVQLAREIGDRRGEAYGLMLIGECERRQRAWREAREYYGRAREIAAAIGSQYLLGLLAGNFAYLAAATGETAEARRRIAETLAIYRATGASSVGLPAFVAAAEVEIDAGRIGNGLRLLGAVLRHPANRQDHQLEVDRVLAKVRDRMGASEVDAGLAAGGQRTWEEELLGLASWSDSAP